MVRPDERFEGGCINQKKFLSFFFGKLAVTDQSITTGRSIMPTNLLVPGIYLEMNRGV